jgi:hypothetical protein
MSNSLLTLLALVGLVVAVVALVVALRAHRAPSPRGAGLRAEVGRIRKDTAGSLRNLAVVRYDAFGDMGGRLSWSLALTDKDGDGIVLTSIHGRSDARTYAKRISEWSSDQPLSPEEDEALTQARTPA